MTARRRSRLARRHPVLMAAGLLLAVVFALNVLRSAGWLLALAIAGTIAYGAIRARRPGAPVGHNSGAYTRPEPRKPQPYAAPAWIAERDQLRAEIDDLMRQVAEARDSAHAAWDAAASVPPRPTPVRDGDARARLLADPRSGARPIGQ